MGARQLSRRLRHSGIACTARSWVGFASGSSSGKLGTGNARKTRTRTPLSCELPGFMIWTRAESPPE